MIKKTTRIESRSSPYLIRPKSDRNPAIAIVAMHVGGCAQLKVDVSEYQGDLIHDPRTQLAEAVGAADYLYGVAEKYQQQLGKRKKKDMPVCHQLEKVKAIYLGRNVTQSKPASRDSNERSIHELWDAVQNSGADQKTVEQLKA